jgi:hypothetical protein
MPATDGCYRPVACHICQPSPRPDSDPGAAITNVGPSLRCPGRSWRPAPTLPAHSDSMVNRFDRHLWRTMPTDDGYRFDLIFASRACASAMMRTTAVFARPRGSALVTLDAAGQVISTAGRLSAGRINSIRTVSPLGVIWPAANSMGDDVDKAGSFTV